MRASNSVINTDSLLPALIFVVLKAKPSRLHSNIQFLNHFSQASGEQLYCLAIILYDSTVRFIELLQAQYLDLSSDNFSLYMRDEPILPSKFVSLFDSSLLNETNNQDLKKKQTFIFYHEFNHHCEEFDEKLIDFNRRLTQSVTDVRELLNENQKETIDILHQSALENEQLTELLSPQIVQ